MITKYTTLVPTFAMKGVIFQRWTRIRGGGGGGEAIYIYIYTHIYVFISTFTDEQIQHIMHNQLKVYDTLNYIKT